MAVVPMQKVRLLVHSTDVDAALDIIQRVGAIEFYPTRQSSDTVAPELQYPHAQLLPRIQHTVHFLAPYAPKIGLWQTLREGSRIEITEKMVAEQLANTDVVMAVVEDLERLQVEFAETEEKIRHLEEQHDLLAEWKNLPIRLADLKTKRTVTLLVKGHQATENHPLKMIIARLCEEQQIPHIITEVSTETVALTLANDPLVLTKATGALESVDAEVIAPPEGTETAEVELAATSDRLAKARRDFALLVDQAEHFAITHYKSLRVAVEVLSWQHERYVVLGSGGTTKYTISMDGWLKRDERALLESEFERLGIAAGFGTLEVKEGEEPPVEIRNSPVVQPFEAVTRLYGMPGYTDLDPTVFLAGFFFLFFGLSLTDVGYGLFLMVASVIILLFFKVTKQTRLFAKLLLFVGFATVLIGALFGGYFGISPDLLPESLRRLQMFDPIGDPLPVFYLALSLGVLQVVAGLMIKIYSEYKNGRLIDGILDQGPWLFLFALGILYTLQMVGYVDILSTQQIINLSYVGVAMVAIASGRHGAGILGKMQSAAAALYSSIGYFSDILSYSRLLALGLATTALAFAVNLIASMIFNKESIITWIFAGLVLLVGHIFTLAVNTLGAFIHSARLQFVEFFGKFIVGTGREFKPLVRTQKHVIVIDE